MKKTYGHLLIGIAALFFAVISSGCATWQPEYTKCAKEQALCVSLCSINTLVANPPTGAPDAVMVAAECVAKCLSE